MVARAGSRDDIDAPHGAAAMWADRDIAFDEGIIARFLISRSVAGSKELTAEVILSLHPPLARKP